MGERGRHGAEPRACVLVAGVQAWAGQQGRCPGQRHLVPGQCVNPGSPHQALSILQEHLDRALKGGVSRHRQLHEACPAICAHGLVSLMSRCYTSQVQNFHLQLIDLSNSI